MALSAPVTRQSWRLVDDGHQGEARLEGLPGGPRGGADAEALLTEATGWRVPVNFLPDWVLGLPARDAPLPEQVARDAQGGDETLIFYITSVIKYLQPLSRVLKRVE